MNIQKASAELHKGFDKLNNALFGGKLPGAAITIQSQGRKKGVLGWCTVGEVWNDKDGNTKKYEINITAEYLNRPMNEVMETLLHEMIHLHNNVNGIKDTSRGYTYHNKRYKEQAEAHGLNVEHHDKIGWSLTSLKPETERLINGFGLDASAFEIARLHFGGAESGKGKGSSQTKWICGCGTAIRATKEIDVTCNECEQKFEKEEKEDAEG